MRRLLPLLVLLVACKDNNKATPTPAPTPAPAPSASTIAAPSASLPSADGEAERVVRAWSDALDKHDVAALEKLYGDPVFFYTKSEPKKTVLAMKKSALGPKSTFHQQIMDKIAVTKTASGYSARFTKRSGNGTKLGDSEAVIVLSGTPLVITEERDGRGDGFCESVAMNVAFNVPAAKKTMADIRKRLEKDPDSHEGGMVPMKMEDGTIIGDWGVFHPEHYERVLFFTAYPNGRVDVTVQAEEYTTDPSAQTMDGAPAKKLPEADRKEATAACGPPAESHGH